MCRNLKLWTIRDCETVKGPTQQVHLCNQHILTSFYFLAETKTPPHPQIKHFLHFYPPPPTPLQQNENSEPAPAPSRAPSTCQFLSRLQWKCWKIKAGSGAPAPSEGERGKKGRAEATKHRKPTRGRSDWWHLHPGQGADFKCISFSLDTWRNLHHK